MERIFLVVDAVINFVLGILLLLFSTGMVNYLGVPPAISNFYPNILGAVFIGITIALIFGAVRKDTVQNSGLGLPGAISINLCGGTVLVLWLIFGGLNLPAKGIIFLWLLAAVLFILSVSELLFIRK